MRKHRRLYGKFSRLGSFSGRNKLLVILLTIIFICISGSAVSFAATQDVAEKEVLFETSYDYDSYKLKA